MSRDSRRWRPPGYHGKGEAEMGEGGGAQLNGTRGVGREQGLGMCIWKVHVSMKQLSSNAGEGSRVPENL